MKPTVVKLFANCIPVKGARRSLICDLQTRQYHFIPQALYEILTEHPNTALAQVQATYGHEHDSVIAEYFEFLLSEGLAFETQEPEHFPALNLAWRSPYAVTNAIVDYDHSDYDIVSVLQQLDALNCQAVHLRFFSHVDENQLHATLATLDSSCLRHVELLLRYRPEYTAAYIEHLLEQFPRISAITVHEAPLPESWAGERNVQFVRGLIASAAHCGSISEVNFCTNLSFFTEALHFNSCLNRKVGVDINGQIKNCPSMQASFGNVRDITLQEAIGNPAFQRLWHISKNQVAVCQDCEFRLVCTDCRAYTQHDGLLEKPAKCRYDPYTATWADN